jgi:hypothetical protein
MPPKLDIGVKENRRFNSSKTPPKLDMGERTPNPLYRSNSNAIAKSAYTTK